MSDSLWRRYRESINPISNLRDIFWCQHDRHATLDGARAITVLLMVMFHVLFGIVMLFDRNAQLIDNFITGFPRYLGWMWQSQGSDPLFLMCGLLVSHSLFREHDRSGTIRIKAFYIKRLKRLMPLFIVALLIYLPTGKNHLEYLWSNLVFLSHYIPGQRHVIPVGWSMDVQMQFYFLLPFLIMLLYVIPWRIAYLVGLCVLALAWRYWVVVSDPATYSQPFYQIIYDREFGSLLAEKLYYPLDVRIGAFCFGILVAYLYHYHGEQLKVFFRRHRLVNAFVLLAGAVLLAGSLSLPVENRYHPFTQNLSATFNILFLAFDKYIYTLGLGILLLMALCGSGPARWLDWVLSWRIWHPFARLIFPLYLFHFPFIVVAAVPVFGTTDRYAIVEVHTYQVFALFFVTVLLTGLFSIVLNIFIENPVINMRPARGKASTTPVDPIEPLPRAERAAP